jgi:hypothetical protein
VALQALMAVVNSVSQQYISVSKAKTHSEHTRIFQTGVHLSTTGILVLCFSISEKDIMGMSGPPLCP